MNKSLIKNLIIAITILILIVQSIMTVGLPVEIEQLSKEPVSKTLGSKYEGHLRVYIVEIKSRWDMENGASYKHAFLDYAFNDKIDIRYNTTYENSLIWQGDVEEDNVQIIAAIFNEESHLKYADPPIGRPFYR